MHLNASGLNKNKAGEHASVATVAVVAKLARARFYSFCLVCMKPPIILRSIE